MTITAHLPIPYAWVEELKAIAESKDPLKKWTAEAREIIRGYLDMRAANAELMEKAAHPQTEGC